MLNVLPNVRDAMLIGDVADNPAEYAERVIHPTIRVVRALRNDPIGQLFSRKQIDDAQHAAARKWQAYREAADTPLRSSGHLQEPVDGGGRLPQGITDRQLEAH